MMVSSSLRRPFALMAAFALLALLLSGWPTAPVRALEDETGVDQIIDNTQADFASGTFQRTVVSAAPLSPAAPDVAGAIELAPVGKLNRSNWKLSAAQLPQPLSDAPVVALGRYLFVIGGATSPVANEANRSNYIYRGVVNQVTGAFETRDPVPPGNDVFTAFTIPAVAPGPDCPPMAGRSRAGAVAVPATAGSNLGYIFIVGGSVYNQDCRTYDFSTNIVQRATVDANGNIVSTGWSAPDSWRFRHLISMATSLLILTRLTCSVCRMCSSFIRTSAGNDFIYAIGGLSIPWDLLVAEQVYPYVFYTKVDATNGNLVHPTNSSSATVWAKLQDLQFDLHSGTAVASYATQIEGGAPVQKEAIFLLGGCTDLNCNTLNTSIWRADVNPNTGVLTWTPQVGYAGDTTPPINVNIQGRQGVTGLSFNNRLYYVTGSTTSGAGVRRRLSRWQSITISFCWRI